MSIRGRFFLGISLLVSLGLFFLIDIIKDDIELRYRESTEEPLVDTSRILASIASQSIKAGKIDKTLFRKSFDSVYTERFSAQIFGLLKTHVDLHVYITNQSGIVIFDSDGGQAEGLDYSQWRDVHLTFQGQYGARTSDIENDPVRKMIYIAAPIKIAEDVIGVLSVGKPTSSSSEFARAAENKLIIGGTVAALILIIFGLLLGTWITQPIQRLTRYANDISQGRKVKRPKLGSHEMETLGQAFEQMRDAIDGKNYVENYVQSLTHEIKSPVSAIQGAAELLQEKLDAQQRDTLLNNIQLETNRIIQIVDSLLLLSSLESRKHISSTELVHLADLIAEVKQSLQAALLIKKITLKIEALDSISIPGEANLIRLALLNILQNAIEFSPLESEITLSIHVEQNQLLFQVTDSGPGIPEYALERVFDRFYSIKRPDSGKKSSGLGLSLVKEIMLLHQGKVYIENLETGGTRVKLFFPKYKKLT